MPRNDERGAELARQLFEARRNLERLPAEGARELPQVQGLTPGTAFKLPQENVLCKIGGILADSGRVYRYRDDVVMEISETDDRPGSLVTLRQGGWVTASAAAFLANLFVCVDGDIQFPPPKRLVETVLHSEVVVAKLPVIRRYAGMSTFDEDFCLRGPGWHPDIRMLVHGPAIEPAAFRRTVAAEPIDRLPRRLRELLAGFCFQSAADLCNFVGVLLTGLLGDHFIRLGKPSILINGNQPGVGKSYLARTLGVVLDGSDSPIITYTPEEEELQKRLCACIREVGRSVIVLDNAKVRRAGALSSAVLEANITAPILRMRILGKSENTEVPNTFLWVVTMNDCKASPDLTSRSVPVCLAYEGDPAHRPFKTDPIEYAQEHRLEILGELAGMVDYWKQGGCIPGSKPHRFRYWAEIIGGVLESCGFGAFLDNAAQAAADFNTDLDDAAMLAEYAVRENVRGATVDAGTLASAGLTPTEWLRILLEAGVRKSELDAVHSQHAKKTKVGTFLSAALGREVPVSDREGSGTATLKSRRKGGGKAYFFEIRWARGDDEVEVAGGDDEVEVAGGDDEVEVAGGDDEPEVAGGDDGAEVAGGDGCGVTGPAVPTAAAPFDDGIDLPLD